MRKFLQTISLLLFTVFFVFATYKLPNWLPADIYLRLDPLLGLNAVFAAREIIGRALWALITLGATLVIGRFFCAYVCPMGVSIDFLDFLFLRKKKRLGLKAEASFRKDEIISSGHFHKRCTDRPLLGLPHGPYVASYALLHLLHLSSGDYPDQSCPGLAASVVSSPGMDNLISPPLSSACLLHVCYHITDLWGNHRP